MPKVIRSTLLLMAVAAPAAAQDKPVALPPKDAAEGWVMLFDGETTFGWKVVEGTAVVKDGKLVIGGEKTTRIEFPSLFADCEVEVHYEAAVRPPAKVPMLRLDGGSPHPMSGKGTAGQTFLTRGIRLFALSVDVPAGETCALTQVRLKPLALKPLFNGKDLTGWHVFKDPTREKATFTVTPAGELHVLGGPGDLQTDAKFADFLLQTEVKTNGPTVNSGIFFRCVPGQYQNGYECQIQNAFKDGARTKPADGGTGAIYRRQAARKVVPNDGEWFTLTLAANGPHLATWVNGYPTANWTDDRKPHENPRTGLRTEAGHLSIQGHNPPMAADVLFRNVRIAEVKK